jgi:hypothetical protein
VKNVLRSLPSIFNPKIFVIEEIHDLDNTTMDELHGILTAYEMSIEKDKTTIPSRKESSFEGIKEDKDKIIQNK